MWRKDETYEAISRGSSQEVVTLWYILPREDLRLGNMGVEKNLVCVWWWGVGGGVRACACVIRTGREKGTRKDEELF